MTKAINYPSPEWISAWCETRHCSPEDADLAWWDLEIEKGNPTPFDLDETAEEVSKEMRKGARSVDAYGKERKRERKADALDSFLFELSELDELNMEFSPQRWNAIVDHVTVHSDGRLVFCFQNGSEAAVVMK